MVIILVTSLSELLENLDMLVTDMFGIPVNVLTDIWRNAEAVRLNRYSVGELNGSDLACGSIQSQQNL